MTSSFSIHPTLAADCHLLGRYPDCVLLLHRNAELPWFIVVPDTQHADFLDLPPDQREALLQRCAAVSAFIKLRLGCSKVNFAGLGNVVPQMHLHIIGRTQSDACWPQPVWGHLQAESAYAEPVLQQWQAWLGVDTDLEIIDIEITDSREIHNGHG